MAIRYHCSPKKEKRSNFSCISSIDGFQFDFFNSIENVDEIKIKSVAKNIIHRNLRDSREGYCGFLLGAVMIPLSPTKSCYCGGLYYCSQISDWDKVLQKSFDGTH